MLVTPLTPQLTIEWFERADHEHEALCLFLTANPRHRSIITDLIRSHIDANIALGKNIGFIVSDPEFGACQEIATNRGRTLILPGETIKPEPLDAIIPSALESVSRHGLWKKSVEIQRLSEISAQSNLEWLEFFSIQKAQLPVLCVLIKGCNPVSIRLGDDISLSKLLKLLGDISDFANHESRIEPHTILDFNRKIARTSQLSERLAEKETELKKLFDTLVEISKASQQDRLKIAEALYLKKYLPNELMQLLKGLDFYASPEFKHRKTIAGIRNKSRAIENLLIEMDQQVLSPLECESISAAVDRISERRNKALSLIKKLANDNYDTSSVDRSQIARKYDAYSIRLDTALNVTEKIASLVSKYKAANLLFAKLISFASSRAIP